MIKNVIKRDGSVVPFDKSKIVEAIRKAFNAAGGKEDAWIAEAIAGDIAAYNGDTLSVEGIQDAVENALMSTDRKDVARRYITYRHQRATAREAKTKDVFLSIIEAKSNEVTLENANMNTESPSGMMMKFSSESTKPFVDRYLLAADVRQAVEDNLIHIHDKDYYPTKSLTCIQHPLDKILNEGFVACHAETRPAKRIETAATLACIAMETAQNEMHGGQAIPAFDFYMAPFVRETYKEELKKIETIFGPYNGLSLKDQYDRQFKDYEVRDLKEMATMVDDDNLDGKEYLVQAAVNNTVKRVHQAMESFIHNMNTIHSRGGNQVVFSSINYGTDTSAEGRLVIRELLRSTDEGVGNGSTAIFPIQIWKKKRGVNYLPGDPNYDLYKYACKVTARRFFPNFLNLDAPFNQSPEWDEKDPKRYRHEVATMGCRTRVFEDRFGESTSVARGNLSFTTLNIVKLALQVRHLKDKEERISTFMQRLDKLMDLAARQLIDRYNFQKTAAARQFPLLMSSLWTHCEELKPNDSVESVIKHGTLGIGFIGLAECLIALTGKHHGESDESQQIGIKIITRMRDNAKKFSDQYDLNFSVIATPAEGLAGRFTKRDRKDYGEIEGITDKEYYTNSNHVPVYYRCSPTHKARVEAPYHDLTRGGHIFYVEMDGDATKNEEAVMQVVDLMDKYGMGYGSINHNRNHCHACGFENAEVGQTHCPKCGGPFDTIQRITGYLVGTTSRWNAGKKAELRDRVVHK